MCSISSKTDVKKNFWRTQRVLHFMPNAVLSDALAYKKKKEKLFPRESQSHFSYYSVILINASLSFRTQAAHTHGRAGVG